MKVALVFLLVSASAALAGGRVGNGFAVPCSADSSLKLRNGYYSLDYLVTMGLGASAPVRSWDESAQRIGRILSNALSDREMDSFDDFVKNVRNTRDYTRKRIWEPSPFGVLNLKTQTPVDNGLLAKEQIKSNLESLVSLVPKSCMNAAGGVDVVPAVVFQDHFFTGRPDGWLVYKFVPQVLNDLEVTDPLQLSYLYIHEWLWDISNNEDRNRRLNHLLHSDWVATLSRDELRNQLSGMGLQLGQTTSAPAVATAQVADAVQRTEVPQSRLSLKDIYDRVLDKDWVVEVPFRAYAVKRTCRAPGDCDPWQLAQPHWGDPSGAVAAVAPNGGQFILRREANLLVLVKSDPVPVNTVKTALVTECPIDHADQDFYHATCRKMWGPDGGSQPTGWLYVDKMAPQLRLVFSKSSVWLGAHVVQGNEETRVAFVAPLPAKAVGNPIPIAGFEPQGDSVLPNGRVRRVVPVPSDKMPQGSFVRPTKAAWNEDIELVGDLVGLRVNLLYRDTLETVTVTAEAPGGDRYELATNAMGADADCERVFAGQKACFLTLRPGFAVKSAKGVWKFSLQLFNPARVPAAIHAAQLAVEVHP